MAITQASLFDFTVPAEPDTKDHMPASKEKVAAEDEATNEVLHTPVEYDSAQDHEIGPASAENPSDVQTPVDTDEALLAREYNQPQYVLEDDGEMIIELGDFTAAIAAPVTDETNVSTDRKTGRGRMKLSDMDALADLIDIPEDEVLFQKRYYAIGTVSEMFKVNISLIRFWENEFDILKPKKNGKGDRHFRPEDIKNLKLIYHLLREKKYTIEGAKDFLRKNKKADETFSVIESLKKMKLFLNELKASL